MDKTHNYLLSSISGMNAFITQFMMPNLQSNFLSLVSGKLLIHEPSLKLMLRFGSGGQCVISFVMTENAVM